MGRRIRQFSVEDFEQHFGVWKIADICTNLRCRNEDTGETWEVLDVEDIDHLPKPAQEVVREHFSEWEK